MLISGVWDDEIQILNGRPVDWPSPKKKKSKIPNQANLNGLLQVNAHPDQMYFVSSISDHRLRLADGSYIYSEDIPIPHVGVFQFKTQFAGESDVYWLEESAFAEDGDYCTSFLDYCDTWGLAFQQV